MLRGVMLTDYHTHTPLCLHAEGNPVDYARHAQKIGLAEIGLSDHNPIPEHFDDWRMLLSDLPRYFELVQEAREVPRRSHFRDAWGESWN